MIYSGLHTKLINFFSIFICLKRRRQLIPKYCKRFMTLCNVPKLLLDFIMPEHLFKLYERSFINFRYLFRFSSWLKCIWYMSFYVFEKKYIIGTSFSEYFQFLTLGYFWACLSLTNSKQFCNVGRLLYVPVHHRHESFFSNITQYYTCENGCLYYIFKVSL